MKQFFLVLTAILVSIAAMSQMPQMRQGGGSMNSGHFYGKVVDGRNNRPVEAATVQLSQITRDASTKESTEQILALVITGKNGDFSIDKLPVMGKFTLLITAVGFSPLMEEVSFNITPGGDMREMMSALDKDLGNFKMNVSEQELEGVVVTANKSMLQMNIDRKVFNVDKDLSTAGGTAVDVMKNVPSVSVDIDGNVALRNKAPQILVDGRPTTLTLEQIPAEEIESIEIITNPSAKFDASGGGAGILNLVLKKNRKAGYNGNLRSSIDTKMSYGLGGDINVKQGKVNLFANGMLNRRKSDGESKTLRTDQVNDLTASFDQSGKNESKGHFAFGRAGLDFFADNRNTFTLSGMLVNGNFNNTNRMDIIRDTTLNNYVSQETGRIHSNSDFSFNSVGGTFGYKHNFAKPNKSITADANYSSSSNKGESLINTQYFAGGNPKSDPSMQRSENKGTSSNLVVQTDYTNPINESMKMEAGLRAGIRDYRSENNNFVYSYALKDYVSMPSLNSKYKFNDQVYAGYMTFSQKINDFSYQLGGRLESSFYTGELIDSNQAFSNEYPFSFFPSVFLSQKLSENQDIQLNYSRKINRPHFYQLIPYFDFTDSLNISRGNPGLKPEFTNLVELSYQYNMKNGNNLLTTLYYRNTNDLIARYTYRDLSPNTAIPDSIFISSFTNASSSSAYGLEITSMNRIAKWWNITTNINMYNSSIDGSNLGGELRDNQLSWFGKINNAFSLPHSFSIQLTGDYTSKTILPPARGGGGFGMHGGGPMSTANGYSDPVWGVDIAIKKDLFKDRSASITLSMNDVLASRVYRTHSRSDFSKNIYSVQDNERFRNAQVVRLAFNWRFGKFDASLFKRKNMRAEQQGMQSGMEGMQP